MDFNSIPSWVNRVTINFNAISHTTTDQTLVRLGTGTAGSPNFTATGYVSTGGTYSGGATAVSSSTTGFICRNSNQTFTFSGQMVLTHMGSNVWICSHVGKFAISQSASGGGNVTLGAAMTQIRVMNDGTGVFDGGSVSIFYE